MTRRIQTLPLAYPDPWLKCKIFKTVGFLASLERKLVSDDPRSTAQEHVFLQAAVLKDPHYHGSDARTVREEENIT